MKIHSLEGIKKKAKRVMCVLSCGETEAAQTLRGITVMVERTPITCIYESDADAYVWIACGHFVDEQQVQAFFDDGKPPANAKPPTVAESLAKFDARHAELLPALRTRIELEGRQRYETLVRLSEQWGVLYHGPEGYLRIIEMATRSNTPIPLSMLAKKQDSMEGPLIAVADQFITEAARLQF